MVTTTTNGTALKNIVLEKRNAERTDKASTTENAIPPSATPEAAATQTDDIKEEKPIRVS